MTMRLGILEDTRGTRETSPVQDGVTKQNIANDNNNSNKTTHVYVFNGAAALEIQGGGISAPEGVP